MQFTGIAPDEEGSIIFDGEKFIVRNPSKIPANFNPGGIPVIGLPPNHPSRRAPLPPAPQPFSHAPPPPPPKVETDTRAHAEPQQPAAPQPSPPDYQQYISWMPEREERQAMAFLDAALDGLHLSDEDAAFTISEALYRADPEGAKNLVKIITAMTPVNGSETISELAAHILNIGMPGFIASKRWAAMPLNDLDAQSFHNYSQPMPPQLPLQADPAYPESAEIDPRLAAALAQATGAESGLAFTSTRDLQNILLIPILKTHIHGYDPSSVAWDEMTIQESLEYFERLISTELMALSKVATVSDDYYEQVQAQLVWAKNMLELAKKTAMNDSETFALEFNIRVEDERTHVLAQIQLIDAYTGAAPHPDYYHRLSTQDLKFLLHSLLFEHVVPPRIHSRNQNTANLYRDYFRLVGLGPQEATRRLQGTFIPPDIVGFLVLMGLTMVFEPLDWALTAVEVAQALSEGDYEAAFWSGFFGLVPFASTKMADAFELFHDIHQPQIGGGLDTEPKYFANPVSKGRTKSDTEFAQILMDEHPRLAAEIVHDASEGARIVKGAHGKGADVLLPKKREREITVHSGSMRNFGSHLLDEARQFSRDAARKEIWIQISNPDISKSALLHEITNHTDGWQTKSGFRELDGVYVKVYGNQGDVWWEGVFTLGAHD